MTLRLLPLLVPLLVAIFASAAAQADFHPACTIDARVTDFDAATVTFASKNGELKISREYFEKFDLRPGLRVRTELPCKAYYEAKARRKRR